MGLRPLNRKRVRKGFPGRLLSSHYFKASAHHQSSPCKALLVEHQEKATRRAQTVLELPASALRLSYPFPPDRQILEAFVAQPPAQGEISGRRGPCLTRWGQKGHSLSFGARGQEEDSMEENKKEKKKDKNWPRQGG